MKYDHSSGSRGQPAIWVSGQAAIWASVVANFDIVVIVCLLMADVRVLQGNSVASFTLYELFIWGYCAPVVVSRLCIGRGSLPAPCLRFLFPVCLYMAWLLIASCFAIAFRADTSVLQNTKNVIPALVLVLFLFVRLRSIRSVILLCNLYIIYCLLDSFVAFLQYKYGAPYFHGLVSGTEYKLDIEGDVMDTPIVGLSDHPNGLAMAVLPGVTLSVLKLNAEIRNRWRVRPITIAVTMVLIAGMAISQARGDVIFTCASIAFMVSPLARTRAFSIKFAFTAVLIVCIVLYNFHLEQLGATAGAGTVATRYRLWKTAIDAMLADGYVPLFGDGTNFVAKWSTQLAGWEFPDSHNCWIDQVLYFGLPALALYVAVWWQFFRIVETPSAVRSPLEPALLDGLRAAIFALMGAYFFEPVANVVSNVSHLFFLMSLAVSIIPLSAPAADIRKLWVSRRPTGAHRSTRREETRPTPSAPLQPETAVAGRARPSRC